ncbi:alkaline phosphatase family protein [Sandaracinobacteroides sp. A072]|uniref:alkaline phosphatase family protein n=1 Tax=Sandaracinobacteroides sp. A072 TaxID=3461146 RepID=UPI00404275DE
MKTRRKFCALMLCALGIALGGPGAFASTSPAHAARAEQARSVRPVLLISIDGLSPESLFEADRLGLHIPVLRQLMREGATAQRMRNINPTVTNPNHTTMVTGVSPRAHGIFNNRPFVPAARLPQGYREYSAIKVPTLWSLAKSAGLGTASLYWPVTRNADDIDINILDGSSKDDDQITRDAISAMERAKPELMTVHYVSHDGAQHEFGPRSREGLAALERIDAAVGHLIAAQRRIYEDPLVVITSDHGFFEVDYRVHLNSAFVEAGLITLDKSGPQTEVKDWRAFAWYVGGMSMVVLKDPADKALRREVEDFLGKLARRPEAGIARIYSTEELKGRGLSDQAHYVIALKEGHHMGNNMEGDLRIPFKGGAHGAFTEAGVRPDMHGVFIIAGKGVPAGRDLGIMDIRQVAPTVAGYLGLALPQAEKPAIHWSEPELSSRSE